MSYLKLEANTHRTFSIDEVSRFSRVGIELGTMGHSDRPLYRFPEFSTRNHPIRALPQLAGHNLHHSYRSGNAATSENGIAICSQLSDVYANGRNVYMDADTF